MVKVGITGLGSCLPETIVTNKDLEKIVDTSEDWILDHVGTKERRISTEKESLPILMAIAGKRALKDANLTPQDIDAIYVGTNFTHRPVPPVAAVVQYLIDAGEISACDIGAGCTGAIYAEEFAVRKIRDVYENEIDSNGRKRKLKILVIGGDILSRVVDWKDKRSCVLLADGAGAAVFETILDDDCGMRHMFTKADGSRGYLIHYDGGFTDQLVGTNPPKFETRQKPVEYFKMAGPLVHQFILDKSADITLELMDKSGLLISGLEETVIVPHQMNLRSIEAFERRLEKKTGHKPRLVYKNSIIYHGNTSTASTLIGLDELWREGQLDIYTPVIVAAFGAGLSWGGYLAIWHRPKLKVARDYDPEEQRGLVSELNAKYDEWKAKLA